ncbi:MAG: hypothetical protein ACT4TC_06465 [Myxococcaceae bacterium]
MAYEGELVKMGNGRWARFQSCSVTDAMPGQRHLSILVAVELNDHYQQLLDEAQDSVESYRRQGIPVHVSIDPDGQGKVNLTVESRANAQ